MSASMKNTVRTAALRGMQRNRILAFVVLLAHCLAAAPHLRAATVNVDCNAGASIGSIRVGVKPGVSFPVKQTLQ